jgi:subtilisin family serine protease
MTRIHRSRFVRTLMVAATALLFAGPASAQSPALAQKAEGAAEAVQTAQQQGHVRVIVRYDLPTSAAEQRFDAAGVSSIRTRNAAAQSAIVETHFGSVAAPTAGAGFDRAIRLFELTPGFAANVSASELEALANDPRVTAIQQDRLDRPTLNDSVPLIGMGPAYAVGATGSNFAVAVLDTGNQLDHEFFTGKILQQACFSNGGGGAGRVTLCPNAANSQTGAGAADAETAQCINGGTNLCTHGSHVAGIAAGLNSDLDTGEPANGVAKSAGLFPVQVFTRFNNGGDCAPSAAPCVLSWTSDQIAGLDHVLANVTLTGGVKVAAVNMSLGGGNVAGTCDGDARKTSIDNLRTAGVVTAISSGNNSFTAAVGAPGCISTAFTVGSTTKSDVISSFSNMSAVVDVMAPGSSILSSIPVVPHSTEGYSSFNGTSMAAPHVAGAVAAIRSACPSATPTQIENALVSTGTPIADTRGGGTITKPRIRVDLAAQQACGTDAVLAVTPATTMETSGPQGGPFTPASFTYQVTSTGIANFTVTNVPSWLTASTTAGTAGSVPVSVTFTVNAAANALPPGIQTATIGFTNTTNGQGSTTRLATLTITGAASPLAVSPSSNIVASGAQGGPFTPASFSYQVSTSSGSVGYAITGVPSWLTASSTSGTATGTPTTVTFSLNAAANSLPAGTQNATITFTSGNGLGTTTRTATLNVTGTAATTILASVLPNARTTTPGAVVTAFATIINTGATQATGCFIAPPSSFNGTFLYQRTSLANIPVGTPNAPVDIAAGQAQTFYFAVTPSQVGTQDIALIFGCTNAAAPTSIAGLNTLLLSTGAAAIPDMLSISATPTNDGNLVVAGPNGTGFMATAAINIGAAGSVTFVPTDTPFGQAARNIPVTMTVCQTNSSGACLAPAGASVTVTAAASQIFTFAVFVQGTGTAVPYDPANKRIFLVAQQGTTPVGETSAALKMTTPDQADIGQRASVE